MFPLMIAPMCPEPPPPPYAAEIEHARYRTRWGRPSVDDTWLIRDQEQEWENTRRHADWETRFKVLGPRP